MGLCVLLLYAISAPWDGEAVCLSHVFEKSKEVREHASLCGPVSLAQILSAKGEHIEFSSFLAEFEGRTNEGVSISELVEVSKKHKTWAQAVVFPDPQLGAIPSPAILIVDRDTHCLVFDGYDQDTRAVRIWDPVSLREIHMPEEELMSRWEGKGVLFPDRRSDIAQCGSWSALLLFGVVSGVWLFVRLTRGAGGLDLARRWTD